MMNVGNRVRVTDGEHHGKTGKIASIAMHNGPGTLRVAPVVLLDNGTEVEIGGTNLALIRP